MDMRECIEMMILFVAGGGATVLTIWGIGKIFNV